MVQPYGCRVGADGGDGRDYCVACADYRCWLGTDECATRADGCKDGADAGKYQPDECAGGSNE